ncbi:MAG: cobalamin biosynthesis protein [Tabrizicola sp.]
MIVAGFGFRSGATVAALREALTRAGGPGGVTHLATVAGKAGGLAGLARELGLPVVAVPDAALRGQATVTRSQRVAARFGTGSLAEAAAFAAAGPGARLRGARAVSADGMATAAIAEGGT